VGTIETTWFCEHKSLSDVRREYGRILGKIGSTDPNLLSGRYRPIKMPNKVEEIGECCSLGWKFIHKL
jgi:hypothetical protein